MIHGLAASLHDWDSLIPQLTRRGYSSYALDLLGHGDSAKPSEPRYQMEWMVEHFIAWLDRLQLGEPPVLVGHSLGGYVALEYAWRFPAKTRGLVLVDPFYSNAQLPAVLRMAYAHPAIGGFFTRRTPEWVIRFIIDVTSVLMGHQKGGLHALPEEVRANRRPSIICALRRRPMGSLRGTGFDAVLIIDYCPQPGYMGRT